MLLYGWNEDPDFGHVRTRLLVSCPSSGSEKGGLLLLDLAQNSLEKRYVGGCMGIARHGDRWIVATDDNQLLVLDDNFSLIAKAKHPRLDYHGIALYGDRYVLVAETAINAIGCYALDTLERVGEIRLNPEYKDVHHLNDVWLEDRTLYVSMFSPYGKWFLDPLNKTGAIISIDLQDFLPDQRMDVDPAQRVVVGSLHMPHTVMIRQKKLAYCDSMSFAVSPGSSADIQLAGFTRGLAFSRDAIFIGQSRMRHVLRIPHQFSNCGLDGGVYVYLPELRISRFIPLPAQQVYQIVALDPPEENSETP
jgi:hypothetical protein